MENPLISFIVPVYMAERYLNRCINSILVQECNSFEIILVDDGSTDNSGKICDEFMLKDSRVRVIRRENGGQGAARNTGLDAAKGKWVCFVDDDDWIDERLCTVCCQYLESSFDIVMFAKRDIYSKYKKEYLLDIPQITTEISSEQDLRALQLSTLNFFYPYQLKFGQLPIGTPWGKLIRLSLLKDNNCRFVEGYGEDRPCAIKVYKYAKKIIYINTALYNYLIHESTMRKYLFDAHKKYNLAVETMHKFIDDYYPRDIEFKQQLYMYDIAHFSYYIVQEYCHKLNKEKYNRRKRKFIQTIEMEPYKTAFKLSDFSDLPIRRKLLASLAKSRCFWGIEVLSKFNDIYNYLFQCK